MYVSVPQESQKDPVSLQESHTLDPLPYDHLVITATLFWPKAMLMQSVIFLFKEPLKYNYTINTTRSRKTNVFECMDHCVLLIFSKRGSHTNMHVYLYYF